MRVQQTVLVLVVSVSLLALSTQEAWSQTSDPFAPSSGHADPFTPASGHADPFGGNASDDPLGASSQQRNTAKAGQAQRQPLDPRQQHVEQVPDKNAVHVVTVGEREMDQRIHMTLQDETSQDFIDTPLNEAVRVLSESHDIPMLIDRRALEEVGLTADTPVNIALHRVSLRSFLRLMLRDLELTYMVKDEVLQITALEAAEQNLETRMYHLPKLLSSKTDKVLAALQSAVDPDTWEVLGGPSTASSIDHVLIVSTTSDVHQQVYDFLDTLIHVHEIE